MATNWLSSWSSTKALITMHANSTHPEVIFRVVDVLCAFDSGSISNWNKNKLILDEIEMHRMSTWTYAKEGEVCGEIFDVTHELLSCDTRLSVACYSKTLRLIEHLVLYGHGSYTISNAQRMILPLLQPKYTNYNTALQTPSNILQKVMGGRVDRGAPVREAAQDLHNLLSLDPFALQSKRFETLLSNSLLLTHQPPQQKQQLLQQKECTDKQRFSIIIQYIRSHKQQQQQQKQKQQTTSTTKGHMYGAGIHSNSNNNNGEKVVVGAAHSLEDMIQLAKQNQQNTYRDDTSLTQQERQEQEFLEKLEAELQQKQETTTTNTNTTTTDLLLDFTSTTTTTTTNNNNHEPSSNGDLLDFLSPTTTTTTTTSTNATATMPQKSETNDLDLLGFTSIASPAVSTTTNTNNKVDSLLDMAHTEEAVQKTTHLESVSNHTHNGLLDFAPSSFEQPPSSSMLDLTNNMSNIGLSNPVVPIMSTNKPMDALSALNDSTIPMDNNKPLVEGNYLYQPNLPPPMEPPPLPPSMNPPPPPSNEIPTLAPSIDPPPLLPSNDPPPPLPTSMDSPPPLPMNPPPLAPSMDLPNEEQHFGGETLVEFEAPIMGGTVNITSPAAYHEKPSQPYGIESTNHNNNNMEDMMKNFQNQNLTPEQMQQMMQQMMLQVQQLQQQINTGNGH